MSDLFSKVGIDLGVVVLLLIVLIIAMMIMTVSMSLRLSRLNQKYKLYEGKRRPVTRKAVSSAVQGN